MENPIRSRNSVTNTIFSTERDFGVSVWALSGFVLVIIESEALQASQSGEAATRNKKVPGDGCQGHSVLVVARPLQEGWCEAGEAPHPRPSYRVTEQGRKSGSRYEIVCSVFLWYDHNWLRVWSRKWVASGDLIA